ncbi:MAG TPA: ABC transporter ATP-binding protein [Balneolales bacterium]|nr:ABC transporter ATP-binding protein [Balneolales bacterium]
MSIIEVHNVRKTFESIVALDKMNVSVEKGEIFGFIGPDGAGKSTLFRILATLMVPDEGKATMMDYDTVKDYREIRQHIGYMPGRFSLYTDLSVEENLRFFAHIYGTNIEEHYDWIKDIYDQIAPFKKRRAGDLSGGMKQKLALSCALIHKPDVLLLDEPTTGVDAVSRREFWQVLQRLKNEGLTIVVSTPYMDEASQCDRVALIQDGHLMAVDTPLSITRKFEKPLYAVAGTPRYFTLQQVRSWGETVRAYPFGERLHLVTDEPADTEELIRRLEMVGITDVVMDSASPTIEDAFIALMEHHHG